MTPPGKRDEIPEERAVPPLFQEGICGSCCHAGRVSTRRGSTFILCALSRDDHRFAKYPRLPVLACPGFRGKSEAEI